MKGNQKKIKRSTDLLTKHGALRYDTRLKQIGDLDSEMRRVKKSGKDISWYEGEFYEYLKKRKRTVDSKVYVFEDNFFVFRQKRLVTVYPIIDKFKPTSQYLLTEKKRQIISNPDEVLNQEVEMIIDGEAVPAMIVKVFPKDNEVIFGFFYDDWKYKTLSTLAIDDIKIKSNQTMHKYAFEGSKSECLKVCKMKLVQIQMEGKIITGAVVDKKGKSGKEWIRFKEIHRPSVWLHRPEFSGIKILDNRVLDIYNPKNNYIFDREEVLENCVGYDVEIVANGKKFFAKVVDVVVNEKTGLRELDVWECEERRYLLEEKEIEKIRYVYENHGLLEDSVNKFIIVQLESQVLVGKVINKTYAETGELVIELKVSLDETFKIAESEVKKAVTLEEPITSYGDTQKSFNKEKYLKIKSKIHRLEMSKYPLKNARANCILKNYINEKVESEEYGIGIIKSSLNDIFQVEFENGIMRNFIYPKHFFSERLKPFFYMKKPKAEVKSITEEIADKVEEIQYLKEKLSLEELKYKLSEFEGKSFVGHEFTYGSFGNGKVLGVKEKESMDLLLNGKKISFQWDKIVKDDLIEFTDEESNKKMKEYLKLEKRKEHLEEELKNYELNYAKEKGLSKLRELIKDI